MRRFPSRPLVPAALLAVAIAACTGAPPRPAGSPAPTSRADAAFLDTLQRRTFDFFWETTNPANGLTPDRWPSRPFSSIAAIGFALTAYPVGVERGYVTREQALGRTLATLRFLWRAPQGPQPRGMIGDHGFFYHFLDMESGERYRNTELSSIDTGLLMAGVLAAQAYFDRPDAGEAEVRALADSLYRRVEWTYLQPRAPLIGMAWRPERGFGGADYRGYNEAMFLYVLALGSPTHPVEPAAWRAFTDTYEWAEFYGQPHVQFAPLFGHQYTQVWIDARGIRDDYMRARGIDYFENSRRATLAQRAYAADNPGGFAGYGPDVWGLTASDGPGDTTYVAGGRERRFRGYWARGAAAGDVRDDGTLAPTAAGGSIPFAPEIAIPALRAMRERWGEHLFSRYGFVDAFNPTYDAARARGHGTVVPGVGWFDDEYLGIDQGPILLMAENHRTGFVWELMKKSPYLVRGLCRAGFRGGWLEGRCDAVEAAADRRMEPFVDSILSLMTLEEKVGQLTQWRGRWGNTGPVAPEGSEAEIRAGKVGSFLGIYGADYTRRLQRIAVEESRLKIPLLFAHDVIHGFRTIFPVPLGEAASWDPDAVERAARIAADEATAAGLHWTFAPMVDIARDPRWGRIVEGAGEDPFLGSAMAAARVRGFQGTDLAADSTLMATAKHFAAYGAAEGGRDYNTVDVSERTLREVYLPPFRAAVDAGVGSIMAAFNENAGVPAHADAHLLGDVLRGEWGFGGLVVSDYTGIKELMAHGVAATPADAGRLALSAGVDVDMVSGIYLNDVPGLVRAGKLPRATVDEAVRRVLRAKYRLGLFQDPFRYSDAERERARTLTPAHRAAARALARESMVLLKNRDGALPLSKRLRTIAVVGPLADDARSMLGSWAAAGRAEDAVTILAGVRRAVPDATVLHARGAGVTEPDTAGFAEAVRAAQRADAVVLVLGEEQDMSAEARNRAYLGLPGVQLELARRVIAAGKPTVVVLLNGRPLAIPWLAEHAPAIVEAWYPGVEAGAAVADILFGDANPGGKLPVTFPRTVGQVPLYYAHKNTGRPASEDDRYTSKYIDAPWTPLYPFGWGLSYTTFAYDSLRLGRARMGPGDTLAVRVDVSNTGARAGEEVVQLYVRDDVASVTRPVMELKGFRRVRLEPGEKRTVEFRLPPDALAFYDLRMRRVVEPGTFTVFVGGSSVDTKQAHFEVVEERNAAMRR